MPPAEPELDSALSERTCIVTRKVMDPDQMIRFVCAPDGSVVPDTRRKLPGRGVWVSSKHAAVAEAAKRKLFLRAFRKPCQIHEDLAEQLDGLLEKAALAAFALANKAGLVVQGFAKVEAAIRSGEVAALVSASDGSADGRGKLHQLLNAAECTVPIIEEFSSQQLDLALGRTNVIHAAVAAGGLADKFVLATRRLKDYRA